ncbi:MAG: DUF481 domain-containing protein [Pseudomonas sp.]|uniref:DUF481 domain-containing protein n=1 Tax=Pseudomonas sp. TaxID=306 RepID=UPI0030F31DE6
MPLRLLLLLCYALPLPVLADTVWLSNGDRLSGDIVLLDGGKLVFNTTLAGRVVIDWRGVTTLAADKPLLMRRDGLDSALQQRLRAAGDGLVQVGDNASDTVPVASINRLLAPNKLLGDFKWEGKLDAKLDMRRDDNSTQEWQLKGETRVEHNRWRHVINGETQRKAKDGQRTDDTWKLEYNLDYFYSPHWFVRSVLGQNQNNLGLQQRERYIGTGPGYRFWDDELGRFELMLRPTRVQLAAKGFSENFNSLGLVWDFKRKLWGTRLEATSKGTLQVPQIEEIDYLFSSEYGLSYRLNDWARLSLLYEFQQNSFEQQTYPDHHYLLGVGVTW